MCECELGYRGEFCEDTVNGSLSLPLTLSVVAVIVGMLVIAFIFAKMRQKQRKRNRYCDISVFYLLFSKEEFKLSDSDVTRLPSLPSERIKNAGGVNMLNLE